MPGRNDKDPSISIDVGDAVVVEKGKQLGHTGIVVEKGQGWYKLKLSGVDGITNVRGCDLKLAETVGDHQQLSAPASPSPARVRHSATSAKKNKAPSSAKVPHSPTTRLSLRSQSPSLMKTVADKTHREHEAGVEEPGSRASTRGSPRRHSPSRHQVPQSPTTRSSRRNQSPSPLKVAADESRQANEARVAKPGRHLSMRRSSGLPPRHPSGSGDVEKGSQAPSEQSVEDDPELTETESEEGASEKSKTRSGDRDSDEETVEDEPNIAPASKRSEIRSEERSEERESEKEDGGAVARNDGSGEGSSGEEGGGDGDGDEEEQKVVANDDTNGKSEGPEGDGTEGGGGDKDEDDQDVVTDDDAKGKSEGLKDTSMDALDDPIAVDSTEGGGGGDEDEDDQDVVTDGDAKGKSEGLKDTSMDALDDPIAVNGTEGSGGGGDKDEDDQDVVADDDTRGKSEGLEGDSTDALDDPMAVDDADSPEEAAEKQQQKEGNEKEGEQEEKIMQQQQQEKEVEKEEEEEDGRDSSDSEEELDLDAMIELAAKAAREHTAASLRGGLVGASMRSKSPSVSPRRDSGGKKRPLVASSSTRGGLPAPRGQAAQVKGKHRGVGQGGARASAGPRGMLDSGLATPKYLQYSGKGEKGAPVTASVRSEAMGNKAAQLMAGSALYRGGSRAMLLERMKTPKDTSAGRGWFNMEEAEMTPELKRDLQVIRMRNYVDPKRFYKASDKVSKFMQVGTVKEGPGEYFSARLTNKERKKTLVDELLVADEKFREYSKRQSDSIQQKKRAGGKAHYKAKKRKRPAGGWKA